MLLHRQSFKIYIKYISNWLLVHIGHTLCIKKIHAAVLIFFCFSCSYFGLINRWDFLYEAHPKQNTKLLRKISPKKFYKNSISTAIIKAKKNTNFCHLFLFVSSVPSIKNECQKCDASFLFFFLSACKWMHMNKYLCDFLCKFVRTASEWASALWLPA